MTSSVTSCPTQQLRIKKKRQTCLILTEYHFPHDPERLKNALRVNIEVCGQMKVSCASWATNSFIEPS